MKAYPITEGEMSDLFALSWKATISFTFAGACLGFSIDLVKDIALSSGLTKMVAIISIGASIASVGMAVLLCFVGGHYLSKRGTRFDEIKEDTEFDE